jgi:type I restriction enzyme S subunit
MYKPQVTGYLYAWLKIRRFIDHLSHGLTGSDLPHITGTGVAEFTIALPPLEEQHVILRRVETLLQFVDKIEKQVELATKRADKLTQVILAKAFRGELVRTEAELARREDRTYESASALLKRIKSEREKISTSTNARGSAPVQRRKRTQT